MIIRDPATPRWRRRTGGRVLQIGRYQATGRRSQGIRQTLHRDPQYAMVRLINTWRALSPAERAAWASFGAAWPQLDKYGFSNVLNGWVWFNKLRLRHEMLGQSIAPTPPLDPFPTYSPTLDYVFFPLFRAISAMPTPPPTNGEVVIVEISLNNHLSGDTPPNPFTSVMEFTSAAPTPYIVAPSFSIQFGPRSHFFQSYAYDSEGRKSEPISVQLVTG